MWKIRENVVCVGLSLGWDWYKAGQNSRKYGKRTVINNGCNSRFLVQEHEPVLGYSKSLRETSPQALERLSLRHGQFEPAAGGRADR